MNITYSGTIAQIIVTNCTNPGCHVGSGPGFQTQLSSYNGVKEEVNQGSFKDRVIVQGNMPPSGSLSLADKEKIQCWLDAGAPDN